MFDPGTQISLTKSDVRYIVTEYGIADLHGKSMRERAIALISIAHPDHRKFLLDEAKKMNLIYADQTLASTADGRTIIYPEKYRRDYVTPQHEIVHFRPILPTDERLIQDLYYTLSDDDRIFRFFRQKKYFLHPEMTKETIVDFEHLMVIVGVIGAIGHEKIIASSSYEKDSLTNMGEIAFTVQKEWRNKGLTKFMLHYLIRIAKEKGLDGFQGAIVWDNKAMVHIIKECGYVIKGTTQDQDWVFSFRFDEKRTDI